MDEAVALENVVVLQVVQASLGLLGPEVRAVSLELAGLVATVHVASALPDDSRFLEDIDDLLSELDVLVPRRVSIALVVHPASAEGPAPQLPGQPTYRARP